VRDVRSTGRRDQARDHHIGENKVMITVIGGERDCGEWFA
jgi:hypothetical protein